MDTISVNILNKDLSFFGIPIYIIVSAIIPVFVFILGYLINRWNENNKENKRLRILENYIFLQIEELIKDITKYNHSFSEFLSKVKVEKQDNYIVNAFNQLHVENILRLDKNDIYKIFIFGRKVEDNKKLTYFSVLDNYFHSIKVNIEAFKEDFDYFIICLKNYSSQWNEKIDIIRAHFEKHATTLQIPRNKDPFIIEFDELMAHWQEIGNFDLFFVAQNLLEKFSILCNNYKKDERVIILSNAIVGCRKSYANVISLKQLYIGLFESYYSINKSIEEKLPKLISEFKLLKRKRIK
jgi:hypothetical protein